ncbi:hypothetical protein H4Q26_000028 [Puccinia striiformis f. sp. tritici PST-130]|nr:hypothetical protein H4Q26_000028 [Puccinia striiformis f. sp. tritici PST-130]
MLISRQSTHCLSPASAPPPDSANLISSFISRNAPVTERQAQSGRWLALRWAILSNPTLGTIRGGNRATRIAMLKNDKPGRSQARKLLCTNHRC